jgi:hypothetical protein
MVLINIKSESDFEYYTRQNEINFVLFIRDACEMCSQMKNYINRNIQHDILCVNIDLIQNYNTRSFLKGLPTAAKYLNGRKLGSFLGADYNKLHSMLNSLYTYNDYEWNSEIF